MIELFLSYGVGILTLWRQEDECLHVSVTGSDTSLNEINVLRSDSFVLLPLPVNKKEDQNLLSPLLICYTGQKISYLFYQTLWKSVLRFVRKSLYTSRPCFHYIMLKINYKFEANDSNKIYYLFCYIFMYIIRLFLLVSGRGKCQDHSPSQPSHIQNGTSKSVQLKHSS